MWELSRISPLSRVYERGPAGRFPGEELRADRRHPILPSETARVPGDPNGGQQVTDFRLHTIDSAPAGSAEALRALEQGLGFVPNLAATMAESPVLVSGFVALRKRLAGGELSGVEREIVALAVSLENDCDYCMAAHSTFALMQNADEEAVAAARTGQEPENPKLAALYRFARSLVTKRGHVTDEETQALLDAGFSRGALFEAVAQVGHTTLANFAHSISDAPLDGAFERQVWAKAAA
jgi:uncharacterized peroxidase-related enzyme